MTQFQSVGSDAAVKEWNMGVDIKVQYRFLGTVSQ